MEYTVKPAKGLNGEITVPGDKSISHRAVMFGSLAEGTTEITGFLMGEDCLSTVACFRQMGVEIEILHEGRQGPLIRVHGRGLEGLQEPGDVLNVGNSGTTARLMLGILAGQPFFSALTGDASIRRRPMGRVTKPLGEMGARIYGRKEGTLAPLAILGGPLTAIDYQSPVASAQVKSALILAGLFAEGHTSVTEPTRSRDHSERMLQAFGAHLRVGGTTVVVEPRPKLTAQKVQVPADISSAAFFLVAGAIVPHSRILIKNVGVNPTRDGVIEVLQAMGAKLSVENRRESGGEPVADLVIESSELTATEIKGDLIPRLIDEIPVLAVAAACAKGTTRITDAEELKVKETDRIATVAQELRKFGVEVKELPDGMEIAGGKVLRGGARCQSHGDHRIAMAMAVAGLAADGETVIDGYEAVDVSFPGFRETLEQLSR